ncbi:MAG TPA: ABC-F family ATP-binding cassette domain-containing protein [Anaerolineae bacterium]|nr:ABC-F family ATP-binding cassette domain-containing protein [Anaerolineae bacterium]
MSSVLQVNNLHKAYGDNVILSGATFTLNHGDRAGLVGPNGCGKTTLLRIIVGQERSDQGSVSWQPPDLRIGYLEQALTYPERTTVGAAMRGELAQAERAVRELAERMAGASGAELERLMAAYAEALERFEAGGGYRSEAQVDAVLAGLGLAGLDQETPVEILSGGQKTRLGLARLLLDRPQLLLLDEPTNHLDIGALEWLEGFLAEYDGAILIVSHDRTFLDHTVRTILELDPVTHEVTEYPGDYTAYVAAKEREYEQLMASYREQQERIEQYYRAITGLEGYARGIEQGTIDFGPRKIAKGIARKATVQKRRLERLLESEDRIEKPKRTWQMKLDFADTPAGSQDALALEGLIMGFGDEVLFEDVNLTLHDGERVVLTGPNGSGKTTLLRIIMGQLEPLAGRVRRGPSAVVGYYSQEQETLDWSADAFTEIRRVAADMSDTDVRGFLHYFLFSGDDVFVPVQALSYGERARLTLAKLVAQGCNLLILDEPINHLDIPSREQFERGLSHYDGTVLAVVHDRYLIERFATRLWGIHDQVIRSYVDLADLRRGMGHSAS